MTQKLLSGELQHELRALARREGVTSMASTSLNNIIMQMRKVANHPELITGALRDNGGLPTRHELVSQSGKMQLMDR